MKKIDVLFSVMFIIFMMTSGFVCQRQLVKPRSTQGTLNITLDVDHFSSLREHNVLAGMESDLIASFDLEAENGTVNLEKLKIRFFQHNDSKEAGSTYSGITTTDMSQGVDEIVFYHEDQVTVIARESVPRGQSFVNVDFNTYEIEGKRTIFARYISQRMGYNYEGSPLMNVMITAEIIEANNQITGEPIDGSNLTVINNYTDAGTADDTDPSKPVTIFPVRISAVDLLKTDTYVTVNGQTVSVARNLVAGQEQVVSILAITADGAVINNWQNNSNDAMLLLDQLKFILNGDITYPSDGVTIERIGGSTNNSATATCVDGVCTVDMYGAAGSFVNKVDAKVTPGNTAYFAIKIQNNNDGTENFSAQVEFDLSNGGVIYTTDEPTQLNFVEDLRLNTDQIESDVLISNY